jgi:hypothetical protein
VGLKSTWGDGRTRFNAAAFYYDYEDFQTFRFELLNQIIFNTDAEIMGGELELQTSPGGRLGHRSRPVHTRCQGEGHPGDVGPSGPVRDREMVAAPDVAANASVRYEWPMLGGKTAIQGTVTYQDDIYYDIQNVPVSFEDGYTVATCGSRMRTTLRRGRSRPSSTTSRTRSTSSTPSTSPAPSASTSSRTASRSGPESASATTSNNGDRMDATGTARAGEASESQTLVSAILLGVVGPEVFIVQPGFVQGMVQYLGFDDRAAGHVASAEMFGIAATTVAMTFAAHRFNWRRVVAWSLAIIVVANLACTLVRDVEAFAACVSPRVSAPAV